MITRQARVYVAGHEGMAGAAIVRRLRRDGFSDLVLRLPSELDLTNQEDVAGFFQREKPEYVFMAAGKVGGIMANQTYPADFIYYNLLAQANVIHSAWQSGAAKLFLLGSSCTYPKDSSQPMKEDYLLSGALEPTSEPYAVAKIAGMKMCQAYRRQHGANFIAAIPADIYGPEDDFDPATAHVLPSLMARIHRAKASGEPRVTVWGSGTPKRELFYADDLAAASLFLMDNYDGLEIINMGAGTDVTIKEMALMVSETVGYGGQLVFDSSKPDGMARKLLDSSRIKGMGWTPRIGIAEGIKETYGWYVHHISGT